MDDNKEPFAPGIYELFLTAIDEEGRKATSDSLHIAVTSPVPEALSFILVNNPFNPGEESQMIEYSVPAPGHIEIQVLTLDNRPVKTLSDAQKDPGSYVLYWDGKDERGREVLSGMYVVSVVFTDQSGERTELFRHSVVIK